MVENINDPVYVILMVPIDGATLQPDWALAAVLPPSTDWCEETSRYERIASERACGLTYLLRFDLAAAPQIIACDHPSHKGPTAMAVWGDSPFVQVPELLRRTLRAYHVEEARLAELEARADDDNRAQSTAAQMKRAVDALQAGGDAPSAVALNIRITE